MGAPRTEVRRLNYLPGEICIVMVGPAVSASSAASGAAGGPARASDAPGPDSNQPPRVDAPTLYAMTLDFLNAAVRDLLPKEPIPDPQKDPFGYDLSPALIQQRLRTTSPTEVFQPIRRPGGIAPWALFPREDQQRHAALLFFNVGSLGAKLRVVRELVNFVNRLSPREVAASGYTLEAAMPNWLGAASADHSCGGPGSRPDPVPETDAANWTFDFKHPALKDLVEDARRFRRDGHETPPSGVVVAVLDTCPNADDVVAAADPSDPRSTWLLREVARGPRPASIGEPPSLQYPWDFEALVNPVDSPGPLTVNWRGAFCDPGFDPHHFLMPDHGLFATGIIRDIAPGANLRLIRVLGDYGVGDLLGLTSVLSTLLLTWRLGEIEGERLIVNLSLMVDVPPYRAGARPEEQRLLTLWFPESFKAGKLPEPGDPRLPDILNPIHQGVLHSILSLSENDILVVAAVGNDGLSRGLRPNPRLPAAYDAVLGVAALDDKENPAAYTNDGEEEPPLVLTAGITQFPNGVAVWGGNATLKRSCPFADEEATIDLSAHPVDAVKGIFTSPRLPGTDHLNRTGWAYWVGTSFATPIISGVAADIWAKHPDLTPEEVAREIRTTFASRHDGALHVPIVEASQRP